jgi:hypothetical protein
MGYGSRLRCSESGAEWVEISCGENRSGPQELRQTLKGAAKEITETSMCSPGDIVNAKNKGAEDRS